MPKLRQLCQLVNGSLKGDPDLEIQSVNSLYQAGADEISFAAKDSIRIEEVQAGALIVSKQSMINYSNLILVEDPYIAFAELMNHFYPHHRFNQEVDKQAFVSPTAQLAANVSIGVFSFVGEHTTIGENSEIHAGVKIYNNVKIGKNCIIYSNVVVAENVEIGDHVIIHPGAVIGADGFGFQRTKEGTPIKIPQRGRVKIGNYCEIGANTCIDRSTIEETVLEDYVKLDNLVQVGHNVRIGHSTAISALTGISGSVEIGKRVIMGGQVGIADHVKIADDVIIAAKTGVTGHIKEKGIIAGIPHTTISTWRKTYVLLRNLEKYIEKIKLLEKKINQLEEK